MLPAMRARSAAALAQPWRYPSHKAEAPAAAPLQGRCARRPNDLGAPNPVETGKPRLSRDGTRPPSRSGARRAQARVSHGY